jgi:hypothetical protein
MSKKFQKLISLSLFIVPIGLVCGADDVRKTEQFATASIRFEQNVTDQDVEVVMEAKGVEEGLVEFSVMAPNGSKIVNVTTDKTTLGLRHFNFETPEPKNINSLKTAYPAGEYVFKGITSSGVKLNAKATLDHAVPEPASLLHPKDNAKEVSIKDLELSWSPVKKVAAYIVSLEQVNSENQFSARLPGSATKLLIPKGFLQSAKEYKLGIGTVAEKGNITYIETSFVTKR